MPHELDETVPAGTPSRATAASPAPSPAVAATLTASASSPAAPAAAERVADTPAVARGTRLAHFEIVRPLGHGGMGEVYLATDLALDRPVALKLLPRSVAADAGRRERLLREARAQARINHPHVCHIYFIGEERGQLFFAMEYVDGETVAQRLERGPLPPDEALELARMAALGLRAAQRHGFTHRDVKPSNLMIDAHGVLKVMDFGLVTVGATAAATPDSPAADGTATALVGTPLYMAPEQGAGRAVDHRADIYALGATLHHLIAGAPPFTGDTAADLISRHATSLRASLADRPRARRTLGVVDAVIAHMMAKRPEDRPASYDELLAELERASTVRSRPAGFWVRALAAGLDLVTLGLLVTPFSLVFGGTDGSFWLLAYALGLLPIAIARRGSTPGHALLELEIVDARDGGRLRYPRAAARMLTLTAGLIAGGLLEAAASIGPAAGALGTASTICYIAGAAAPFVELARATWRTPDHRTLWDRAAGSRVRYRVGGSRGGAAITVNAAQVVASGGSAPAGNAAARAA
jgi:uncharacterized RDD family membrane protein YckC